MEQRSPSFIYRLKLFTSSASIVASLPLLTAALLCVCLTTESGAGLCLVALVPFAYVLVKQNVPRATYASTYLAGLAVHLVGMAWVLDCYRYENVVGPYAVQWFWIGTWGGFLLVSALAIGRIISTRWRLPATVLLPMLWVAYEFIRHEMADFATGTGFPWLKLGTSLADNRYFVQIADLGGEYLLSFLVAMINGALVDLALLLVFTQKRTKQPGRIAATMVSTLTVLLALGYGDWRASQSPGVEGPTVVLMGELDLPPLLPAARIRAATGDRHADLLLWPELAYHHSIFDIDHDAKVKSDSHNAITPVSLVHDIADNQARRYLQQSAKELGSTLVIGCKRIHVTREGSCNFNSLACVDPLEGYQGCYDKVNLVPGAEATMRSAELFDASKFAYSRGHELNIFRLPSKTATYRFAPAICYDLCFGKHFRSVSTQKVDFLVQSGAEGQDDSGKISWLMLRYARIRAIENRRALVRNATLGHSALIDSNGVVRAILTTEPITSPTWLGAVPIDTRWSLYSRCGDWVAYVACLATLGLVVPVSRRPRLGYRFAKRSL